MIWSNIEIPEGVELGLANANDAEEIAEMSRDLIEYGLGWRWTPAKVRRQIRNPDSLVLLARVQDDIAGFAIMHFAKQVAHLNLLAVKPLYQRSGIGGTLLNWLEKSAQAAGISEIHLELRFHNEDALVFYQAIGYQEIDLVPGYYSGRESALRMVHHLKGLGVSVTFE